MTLILLYFQIMIFSKKIILVLILLAWECLLSLVSCLNYICIMESMRKKNKEYKEQKKKGKTIKIRFNLNKFFLWFTNFIHFIHKNEENAKDYQETSYLDQWYSGHGGEGPSPAPIIT